MVQKYGGVCLDSPAKIKNVASQIATLSRSGVGVVVVVSAMGKTTDDLVRLAYQISNSPNRRELDMLLSTGERVSMALMSMALHDLGCRAMSFTGSQAGVLTDGSHSNARILDIKPIRIEAELQKGSVIVLAGFQGVNPDTKEITTLGRGGSDTTAVAMAARLKSDRCEIIKEVDGICTADPKIVSPVRVLPEITYASLREMCFWGAKVLNYRSVALAESLEVPLLIRHVINGTTTRVSKEVSSMEMGKLLSVNSHEHIRLIAINERSVNQALLVLDQTLREKQLPHLQILNTELVNHQTRALITGDLELLSAFENAVNESDKIKVIDRYVSSVSLTCHGQLPTDLETLVAKTLLRHQIEPSCFLFSPLSLTLFVGQDKREATIQALHGLISENSI